MSREAIIAELERRKSQPQEVDKAAIMTELQKRNVSIPSFGRTVLEQGLQGATFGLSDEIAGAVGGIGAKLYDKLTGQKLFEDEQPRPLTLAGKIAQSLGSLSSIAGKGIDTARQELKSQQEQRPILSTASQLGGGVLTGLAGAGTAAGKAISSGLGGAGLPARVLQGAGLGATSGAAYGAGTAEGGIEQRLSGAGEGALFGGVTGAALPVAGVALRQVMPAASKVGEVAGTLIRGRDADKILASRLSNQNLPELRDALRTGSTTLILPDVAGDEVKGLMRAVGRTPGGAKDIVSDYLETRSEYATKRISDLLSKKVSNVDAYFGNLDDIAKARSTMAAPLYKQAYEEAPKITNPALGKFLQDKRILDAMQEAKTSYGVRLEASPTSLETLDGVKKVLDDKIGAAMADNKKQLAASYTILKNGLLTHLDEAAPTYKKARQTFAGFAAMEEAQKAGLKFATQTPEQLKRAVKDMGASELEAFKVGVRESLQTTVNKTADGADAAKRLFGNQQKRQQLEAVFGGGKNFTTFANRLRDEIAAAETKFKVLGGSRTDVNLADDGGALIEAATDAIRSGKMDVAKQATNALATGIYNRFTGLTPENSKRLARILTNREQGIKAIDRIIALNQDKGQKALLSEIKTILPAEIGALQLKGD